MSDSSRPELFTSSHFVPWSNLKISAPVDMPRTGYLSATQTNASGNASEAGKCFTFTDDFIFGNGFN